MPDDSSPNIIGAIVTYVYERVDGNKHPTLARRVCDSVATTYTYPGTENRRPRSSAASNEESGAERA